MAVHKDDTLAPFLHIKEGVAHFVQVEGGVVEHGAAWAIALGQARELRHLRHRQAIHLPLARQLAAVNGDGADDTLVVVLNARAVVDASEVFDEDVQGAVEGDVHEDAVLVHHTVEFAHLLAVHIDGGIVGNARHVHHTLDGLVEMAAVEHIAEALSQVFKVHWLVGLHGLLRFQHREYVGRLVEIHIGNRDDGNALGDVGNGVGHVLLHQFAHAQEFLRGPSCFADRCIVVVGRQVGLNVRVVVVVGARPETKVRATVHHIEVEIDAVVEVLLRLVHNALGRNAHEGFVPVVQPSGIELCHHIGALAVVVLVDYVFEVLHIVFAVGRGQCALDGTAFKEPRTIARKHRNVEASVQQRLSDGRAVPFVLG